jgi:spore cortex formation protein SpoVR/YcgB (stage V sporulation)
MIKAHQLLIFKEIANLETSFKSIMDDNRMAFLDDFLSRKMINSRHLIASVKGNTHSIFISLFKH